MREFILSPSLLSADFYNLESDIKAVEKAGAKYLHLDVIDGAFAPSITFGMPIIKSLRPRTDLVFDTHLMIEEPLKYVKAFADAGADIITIHAEADKHIDRTLHAIKDLGKKCAVSINPATPIEAIKCVLPVCDMVLLMSVNPGFSGQAYIPYVTDKIKELASLREGLGLDFDIEVDGGVKADNIDMVMDAGANIIVAGSAVFGGDTFAKASELMNKISARNK